MLLFSIFFISKQNKYFIGPFYCAFTSWRLIFFHIFCDKSYNLVISWIMTPFKKTCQHNVFKLLYNYKHICGCFVIKNTFKILKTTFKELFWKFKLHMTFIIDVSICVYILHNLLNLEAEFHI